jgi:hypothetical protein
MATLQDALKVGGCLERVPLPDWEDRQPIRLLYATPDFLDDIETDGVLHDPELAIAELTLYEHLWQRMSDFQCLERPGCGDLHLVMPVTKGVWKIHPNGLRVFGWAPAKHSLALVCYALASDTHSVRGLVAKKRDEVLRFIERHGLGGTVQKGGYLEVFPHQ